MCWLFCVRSRDRDRDRDRRADRDRSRYGERSRERRSERDTYKDRDRSRRSDEDRRRYDDRDRDRHSDRDSGRRYDQRRDRERSPDNAVSDRRGARGGYSDRDEGYEHESFSRTNSNGSTIRRDTDMTRSRRRDAKSDETKLFVGGLAWATDNVALAKAFSAYTVVDAAVVMERDDPSKSRGFGAVKILTYFYFEGVCIHGRIDLCVKSYQHPYVS